MRRTARLRAAAILLGASLAASAPSAALAAQGSPHGGTAQGTITVTSFTSRTVATAPDGTKFEDNTVGQIYSGGVTGTGPLEAVEILRPDGNATFVGSEFITCRLAGRSGTLLLDDVGTVHGTVVHGTWEIVGGLGGLAGIQGRGSFAASLGKGATYVLHFHFTT
jgi:Protein of unknown function (DUF3224)